MYRHSDTMNVFTCNEQFCIAMNFNYSILYQESVRIRIQQHTTFSIHRKIKANIIQFNYHFRLTEKAVNNTVRYG